jgi:hypothetical protein
VSLLAGAAMAVKPMLIALSNVAVSVADLIRFIILS